MAVINFIIGVFKDAFKAFFFRDVIFAAIDDWVAFAKQHNLTTTELALRWLAYHSQLSKYVAYIHYIRIYLAMAPVRATTFKQYQTLLVFWGRHDCITYSCIGLMAMLLSSELHVLNNLRPAYKS